MPMADEAAQNAVDNNDVMLLRNRLSRIYFLRRFFDYQFHSPGRPCEISDYAGWSESA